MEQNWQVGITAAALMAIGSQAAADGDFDEKVRQALLNNPEIVLEVFAILEKKNEVLERKEDLDLIGSVASELFALDDRDDGPIDPVIVEFIDYQCGYCRRAEAEIADLKQAHPEIKVRLIQFPILGEKSVELARLALAVRNLHGDERYHLFNEIILKGGDVAVSQTDNFLTEMGFDATALRAAADNPEIDEELAATHELARKLRITGTPGFVTPSRIHRGYTSAADLARSARWHLHPREDRQ